MIGDFHEGGNYWEPGFVEWLAIAMTKVILGFQGWLALGMKEAMVGLEYWLCIVTGNWHEGSNC